MDEIAMWLGYATAGAGLVGILAVVSMWALDKAVMALKLKAAFFQWAADHYRKKHRSRHPAG